MRLSRDHVRVLGSLVEKELTTPQQYPLTIKSLVAACSQASNREPVIDYDESTVSVILDELKGQRLIRFVLPSHGRTATRYRHVLDEVWALDVRQRALLAVLWLRGPQTVGELRLRTDRMAEFDGLTEVEHELEFLADLEEPLVERVARRPGQKEERWLSPIVDDGPVDATPNLRAGEAPPDRDGPERMDRRVEADPAGNDRDDTLRSELTTLRLEVGELRREFDALRASLGE